MNKLKILFLIFVLTGCATTTDLQPVKSKVEIIRLPEIGQVTNTRLGDSLLKYASSNKYQALRIKGFHRYPFCLFTVELDTQDAPLKYTHPIKGNVYKPNIHVNEFANTAIRTPAIGTITGNQSDGYYFESNGCGTPKLIIQDTGIVQAIDLEAPSFTQELIYNGRVGNNLKIIYREFSGDMARTAFSQEAQYDLSASNIIAFKGAQLKILNATNESIEYEVLSHFEKIQF